MSAQGPNPFPPRSHARYPDSFYRFAKIIPMLTDPSLSAAGLRCIRCCGTRSAGYGFSDKPGKNITIFNVSDIWALDDSRLGYEKFGAHAEIGAARHGTLARSHPGSVVAIHLTDVPFGISSKALRVPHLRNTTGLCESVRRDRKRTGALSYEFQIHQASRARSLV